jgi:hypothetical protein
VIAPAVIGRPGDANANLQEEATGLRLTILANSGREPRHPKDTELFDEDCFAYL